MKLSFCLLVGGGCVLMLIFLLIYLASIANYDPAACIIGVCSFLVRHGYPWVPTDQAHGRPRQVGPTYQKTRRPVSGLDRLSWWPTRPPEDLLEDSPDDLTHHDLKTRRTRQDLGGFRLKQIDEIWQDV
jgi:hypothetical protein